jgi:hypothetical protein
MALLFFGIGFRAGFEAHAYKVHAKVKYERLIKQDTRRDDVG